MILQWKQSLQTPLKWWSKPFTYFIVRRSHPRMAVSLAVAICVELWWGFQLAHVNLGWPRPSRAVDEVTWHMENGVNMWTVGIVSYQSAIPVIKVQCSYKYTKMHLQRSSNLTYNMVGSALFRQRALYTVHCTNTMHSRKPSFAITPPFLVKKKKLTL